MQTLKIKYETSSLKDLNLIKEYQKQYSSLLHYVYNRTCENISQKDIKDKVKSLSHINLLDSWFIQSSIFEAKGLHQKSNKIIFGGKKNFFDRLKGKISKSEYKNYFFKKMKFKYRLSLDDKRFNHLKFSRFFSDSSLIYCI